MTNSKRNSQTSARGNSPLETQKETNRNSTSLVVAGLVTIVGSWVGMAAYVDYRLDGLEKNLAQETQRTVSAEAESINNGLDSTKSHVNEQIANLDQKITSEINENSSTIAKGLVDLIQEEEKRFSQTVDALTTNKNSIEQAKNEIATALVQSTTNAKEELASLITKNQEKQTKELTQLASLVQQNSETNTDLKETLNTTLQSLDETKEGILTKIESSSRSVQDLIELSNKSRSETFAELASTISTYSDTYEDDTQKLSKNVTALSQQVSTLKDDFISTQSNINELAKTLPTWKEDSEKQILALKNTSQSLQSALNSQVSALQNNINDMNKMVDKTTNSLLKSFYSTAEGIEGTKLELKTDMARFQESTSDNLEKLTQSMQTVSSKIEEIKAAQPGKTVSSDPAAIQNDEVKEVVETLETFREKIHRTRSDLTHRFSKARDQAQVFLEQSQDSEKVEQLQMIFKEFSHLAENADSQLNSMTEGIQDLHSTLSAIAEIAQGEPETETKTNETAKSSSDSETDSGEIGMNTEDRSHLENPVVPEP